MEATCLRGPEKKLSQTRLLQPLLVAVSLGYLRHLNERGVQPDLVLGHSLGEITALAVAGVVTPTDAVRIAARRGELMDEAALKVEGGMLAATLEDRTRLLDWLAASGFGAGQYSPTTTRQLKSCYPANAPPSRPARIHRRREAGQVPVPCRVRPVAQPLHGGGSSSL